MSSTNLWSVTFSVARKEEDDFLLAQVTAQVSREELVQEENFLNALREAITRWAIGISKPASFNVGDLMSFVRNNQLTDIDPDLLPFLKAVGIEDVFINEFSYPDISTLWSYDQPLIDPEMETEAGDKCDYCNAALAEGFVTKSCEHDRRITPGVRLEFCEETCFRAWSWQVH